MNERDLLAEADARGLRYLEGNSTRRVFPDADAIAALSAFDEPLPQAGESAEQTLALLDDIGIERAGLFWFRGGGDIAFRLSG